jgi:pyridoxal/pyridoxine/pyridoxamine kinase
MGDDGEFYVTPDLVPVYCDKVVAAASMLTPNKFEAEHLTHRWCDDCPSLKQQN